MQCSLKFAAASSHRLHHSFPPAVAQMTLPAVCQLILCLDQNQLFQIRDPFHFVQPMQRISMCGAHTADLWKTAFQITYIDRYNELPKPKSSLASTSTIVSRNSNNVLRSSIKKSQIPSLQTIFPFSPPIYKN